MCQGEGEGQEEWGERDEDDQAAAAMMVLSLRRAREEGGSTGSAEAREELEVEMGNDDSRVGSNGDEDGDDGSVLYMGSGGDDDGSYYLYVECCMCGKKRWAPYDMEEELRDSDWWQCSMNDWEIMEDYCEALQSPLRLPHRIIKI